MEYIQSLGIIGAILYLAYVLMARAKSDKIIAELQVRPSKEKQQTDIEIAQAIKEAADAKIVYDNSRRKYNEFDSVEGTRPGADSEDM
jgi:hypothetical protein